MLSDGEGISPRGHEYQFPMAPRTVHCRHTSLICQGGLFLLLALPSRTILPHTLFIPLCKFGFFVESWQGGFAWIRRRVVQFA